MMVYGKTEPMDIYEVKALLYVQEAQMDNYRQELSTNIAKANVA